MLTLTAVSTSFATASSPDWASADAFISAYEFLPDVSFSAGDATGRKHTFTKGKLTMQTPNILASSSKFPAAVAIMGAVEDAAVPLTFDTRIADVFEWWTQDPTDIRSAVTLHHLLTFTSGMVSDDFGTCGIKCLDMSNTSRASLMPVESCAVEIFEYGPWNAQPGSQWSYHSLHLQLAGAMASKASGLSLPDLLHKYLLDKLGMTSSYWVGNTGGKRDPNPHLAAALTSTGDDYDKMLQAVLTYEVASKEVLDVMEEDAYRYYPNLVVANNSKDLGLEFYGHYSMCTYFECIAQPWSDTCEKAGVHADPGYFGYWPLINRPKGYYMQLVVARQVSLPPAIIKQYNVSDADIGALAAQCVFPLRQNLTDPVEAALGRGSVTPTPFVPLDPRLQVLCDSALPGLSDAQPPALSALRGAYS